MPERSLYHVLLPWSMMLEIERKMFQNEIFENCDLKAKKKRTKTKHMYKWTETIRACSIQLHGAWILSFEYRIKVQKNDLRSSLNLFSNSGIETNRTIKITVYIDDNHIHLNIAISIIWKIIWFDQNIQIFSPNAKQTR